MSQSSELSIFFEAKTQEAVTRSLFLKPYAGWATGGKEFIVDFWVNG